MGGPWYVLVPAGGGHLDDHCRGVVPGAVGDREVHQGVGGCLRVGGLAGVVEETAGDEASVAFEDNVLALFLDDCPRLGGIKTVFGDTFRQGNDLWPEFPQ